MKLLILFATLAVAASAGLISEWSSFKVQHKKEYGSELEERMRMQIYHENKKMIDAHNEKFEQGLVTYKLAMNHFGDLTPDEFRTLMNGYNKTKMPMGGLTKGQAYVPSNEAVPDTMDWRTKGAVTPVKDQAQCGSCWAFSAVGSLEGQHFLKTGKLVSLSEQNLVDCSGSQGNFGCGGGWMDQAFEYVKENGGIDTEDSYPYEGVDGTCRFNKNTVGATCTGFVDIPAGDEGALKNAVGTVGPISVAIDAGHSSFQFYQSGVYYEPDCSTDMLDHGVLSVGYGTENGQDYWLVKNSWNTVWGDQGYIKMARNKNNHCGIASKASYPTM